MVSAAIRGYAHRVETPEFVRLCLTHFRHEGLPFMVAWTRTLQAIPRGTNVAVVRQRREWVDALKWSRPAWQAAYEREQLAAVLELEAARRQTPAPGPALELVG